MLCSDRMQNKTTDVLTFRPALEADFEALLALRLLAMHESLAQIGRFDPDRARERLRSSFSAPHTWHIIANGESIGFFALTPTDGGLLLDHLYVLPVRQSEGVGSRVLAHVFAQADAQRLPVRVGALKQSAANRFYARHGFIQVEQSEWDVYYLRPCASDTSEAAGAPGA